MKLAEAFRSLLKTKAAEPASPAPGCCGGRACDRPPKAEDVPAAVLEVVVEKGYRPARLSARAGEPLRVTFLRHETSACSKEVVFPGLGIRRALPTGERVTIDLPPLAAGVVPFTCGMGMMKGGIDVR